MYNRLMVLTVVFLLSPTSLCTVLITDVDAHAESCFFNVFNRGQTFSLVYEVKSGGFQDVDVSVHAPSGNEIHKVEHRNSGSYMFPAPEDGKYTLCFSNQKSSRVPKQVMFSFEVPTSSPLGKLQPSAADGNFSADQQKLKDMIEDLSNALYKIKLDQEFMDMRLMIHHDINKSTNKRVTMWAFFEALIMLSMTMGQVYYLMRFFEVRRVV
ncbi:hypothetical protein ACOME3_004816 [Neoechinorhynchus agilis]